MSTQKRKFELFARLQTLGFTCEEAASLRRIEMTLQRWAEKECNGDIQRDETTGKPRRYWEQTNWGLARETVVHSYVIADREAGALRRLAAIVSARNARVSFDPRCSDTITAHHQGDCRGCMVYLCTRANLTGWQGDALPIDSHYTRGLAVCA